jgi:hypothetical protein
MPCPLCGTTLLFTDIASNKTACPKCDHILVVDRMLATRISTERLTYLYGLFMRYMRQFKKNQLIAHIIWEREKYSRDFFENYQGLDMSRFVSYSYLIKNLMAQSFDGYREANAHSTPEIISRFSDYLGLLTEHIYLKEGFAEMIAKQPFDPNPRNLTIQRKLSQFRIMYNEDYTRLIRTFANNEIYPEVVGRQKIAEYRKEWEMIMGSEDFSKKVTYTPEGLIKKLYAELNHLYCGLLKNVVYASTFDFSYYRGIVRDPGEIMDLANSFALARDCITVTPSSEFELALTRVFAERTREAKAVLLLSETNKTVFPLFVLLDDYVFISHRTSFLIYLFLHPIIFKGYFDSETARRSKELETSRTRDAFENAGFVYVPDVKDNDKNPSLQIDGLAGKEGVVFVIEVKGWGLTTFYEHKNKHQYLERDLKGVVDGIEYTTKDDKLCKKKIPSLLEKIKYVENKMHDHGFDPTLFRAVRGVVVVEDFPPLDEYKGIRMIGLQDISNL